MTGQDKNNETKTRKDQMMDSFLDTGTDSMTEWGKEFIKTKEPLNNQRFQTSIA